MVPPILKIPTGWRLHVHNPHLHPRHEERTSLTAVIKQLLFVNLSEDIIDQNFFQTKVYGGRSSWAALLTKFVPFISLLTYMMLSYSKIKEQV